MRHLPRLISASLAALTLAACENATTAPKSVSATGPRFSKALQSIRQPFPFEIYGCDGSTISGSGYLSVTITTTTDAAGGYHFGVSEQTTDIKATSTSGASYVASEAITSHSFTTPAGGGTSTSTDAFRLIGQGQAPNEVVHSVIHYTVDANGNVTSNIGDFADVCH